MPTQSLASEAHAAAAAPAPAYGLLSAAAAAAAAPAYGLLFAAAAAAAVAAAVQRQLALCQQQQWQSCPMP